MNAMAISIERDLGRRAADDEKALRSKEHWTAILFATGGLGTAAGLVGIIVSIVAAIGVSGTRLSSIGAAFVAAAFPLFILAAHSMDKIADANKSIRLDRCRRNGLDESTK